MKYELMLLLRPLTNEDVKEKVFPKIEKAVTTLNGDITIKDTIGKRMLAYDIDGFKEGYYLLCEVSLESDNVQKLEQAFKLMNNEIVRFLLISDKNL